MPTTYAHWSFGNDCIQIMPTNIQKIIMAHRDLYDLGVHGPDIFFYNILNSKSVKYGYALHNIPVEEFFKNCKKVFHEHSQKDEMLSYLLGFLTHFTLDSMCHGYVERKIEESKVSHNRIETEWDKHLMILDNLEPNLVDRKETLKPNKINTEIISYFYPFDSKVLYQACRSQIAIIKLLNCPNTRKYNFFQKNLKKRNLDKYADLFIGFDEFKTCKDSNLRLDKLRTLAYKRFPKLMKNFIDFINDSDKLDSYFNHDFGPWEDYKKIKVLSYNSEIKYKV